MFLIKIYIKESYINYYHTIIQMCGQYCILAPYSKVFAIRRDNFPNKKRRQLFGFVFFRYR